jgi:hypothetical protein
MPSTKTSIHEWRSVSISPQKICLFFIVLVSFLGCCRLLDGRRACADSYKYVSTLFFTFFFSHASRFVYHDALLIVLHLYDVIPPLILTLRAY